jgi:hypothetical protein
MYRPEAIYPYDSVMILPLAYTQVDANKNYAEIIIKKKMLRVLSQGVSSFYTVNSKH